MDAGMGVGLDAELDGVLLDPLEGETGVGLRGVILLQPRIRAASTSSVKNRWMCFMAKPRQLRLCCLDKPPSS
jgi:hypothetical protein